MAGATFVSHILSIEASAVATGDFDRDGHTDLVGAGEPELTIFLGDGEAQLVPASRVPGGEYPVDFAVADLNGNGTLDIAVANHDTNYITLLLSDRNGTFRPFPNSPLRITPRRAGRCRGTLSHCCVSLAEIEASRCHHR